MPHAARRQRSLRRLSLRPKPALAVRQIEAALDAGYARGVVLADAAYGDETAWREPVADHGLKYALAMRPRTSVWWGSHQPLTDAPPAGRVGRPRQRLKTR